MPHYGYVYDPNANDPGWKNVTGECQLLFDDLMPKAENLFGPRTSTLPVLVTEFSTGPHIHFINNSIAYIRLGPGVRAGANLTPAEARQLKHQLALEIVHLLSVPVGAPMTALEEGASGYFAEYVGGYTPGESGAPQKYIDAHQAVKELLDDAIGGRYAIKELRQPLCSINRISAEAIRGKYPDCSQDLIDRLTIAC